MDRRSFLIASAAAGAAAASGRAAADDAFPLVDLHVHLTREFPIERMLKIAQDRSVTFGIVEHPAPWAIKDDADLRRYVEGLRPYPVYVGLQPMEPGWDKAFSKEALALVDYVLMDPQSVPLPGGGVQRIWELQTYVEDTDEFMAHTPDERFIRMAREQGLKFTFGSDARNADAGRLAYCKSVARRCGLTGADFYLPRRRTEAATASSDAR